MDRTHKKNQLPEIDFDNARFTGLGIESMALAELRTRATPERLAQSERVNFYIVLLITGGSSTHTVDFVHHPIGAGSLVFVRPGQVHQWHMHNGLDGHLVLFTPTALQPLDARPASKVTSLLELDLWPAAVAPPRALLQEITLELARLRQDFERFDQSAVDVALIRQVLVCLLLRLARWHAAQSDGTKTLQVNRASYRLFVRELEMGFGQRLGVQHYAKRLGYSESTLSRACIAAEGRSAKQVIDRRVALEAQRLLVHSEDSVAAIGHQLGFSEPTNFVKFFSRMIGVTPNAFRQKMDPRLTPVPTH